MDILTAIDTRSTAVKLGEPGPSAEQIARLIGAAIRAPDHGRLAPWRFVVIAGERRRLLGDAMAAIATRANPGATAPVIDQERGKAMRAPVIIAVAARLQKDHRIPEIEQVLAVGAAVENMILAAGALGFGSMWKTGAAAYDPDLKAGLGLDRDDTIAGFVYLGTTINPGPIKASSAEGLVHWL